MIAPSNQYIAVLDTSALVPMPLCDSLLRLAEDPSFHIPRCSSDMLRELRSTIGASLVTETVTGPNYGCSAFLASS